MAPRQENRLNERRPYAAKVMLYTKDNSDDYYYGSIYNQSKGGMYIKTDADLKGNQCYVIKISNNGEDVSVAEKYTEYYGIVRWAQFASSSDYGDSTYKYGYGMEYTEPSTSWRLSS